MRLWNVSRTHARSCKSNYATLPPGKSGECAHQNGMKAFMQMRRGMYGELVAILTGAIDFLSGQMKTHSSWVTDSTPATGGVGVNILIFGVSLAFTYFAETKQNNTVTLRWWKFQFKYFTAARQPWQTAQSYILGVDCFQPTRAYMQSLISSSLPQKQFIIQNQVFQYSLHRERFSSSKI